jgi:hypothetical protein
MSLTDANPDLGLRVLRFAARALRICSSTVAVVALLRQQWLAGTLFGLAWLLIVVAPLVIPPLEP